MIDCKYWNESWSPSFAGRCSAPNDVSTNAANKICLSPQTCPYLLEPLYKKKSQMTEQQLKDKLPPDIIEIGGVKYQKVKEPEPKTLKELFEIYVEYGNWAQSKDVIAQELVNIVKEFIPKPIKNNSMSEYLFGYNEGIRDVSVRLFNDIL